MEKLETCLYLHDRINNINEKIELIKARLYSPKNQVLSGMPHSGNVYSDNYAESIEKLNKLKRIKAELRQELYSIWADYERIMDEIGVQSSHQELIKQRFYCALSWNKCVKIMQVKYSDENWNTNKAFRIYRNVRHKLNGYKGGGNNVH